MRLVEERNDDERIVFLPAVLRRDFVRLGIHLLRGVEAVDAALGRVDDDESAVVFEDFCRLVGVEAHAQGFEFFTVETRCDGDFAKVEGRGVAEGGQQRGVEMLAAVVDGAGFGQLLENVTVLTASGRKTKNKSLFDELPVEFTKDEIKKGLPELKGEALRKMIYRWLRDDLIEKIGSNQWRKKRKDE